MATTPQRIVWEDEATKCLIEARRHADAEFRANKRTKPIWERVAQYLNAKGHFFTFHQCHVKWKNLLRDYRLTKQHNANNPNESKEMQAGPGFLGLMDEFLETNSPTVNPSIWPHEDQPSPDLGNLVIPSDAIITRPPSTTPPQLVPLAASNTITITPNSSPTANKSGTRKRVPIVPHPMPSTFSQPLMCVSIHTKKKSPYKSNVIVTKGMTFEELLNHVFPNGPPVGKRFVTRTALDDSGKEYLPNQSVDQLIGGINGHADLWVGVEDDNVNYDELF
ncbi:hypothetical protein G9A89_009102 [Geosiphon pyriformis]|nr:hypothetical protein G9A89_009102 [Geosiphon pyriformis]